MWAYTLTLLQQYHKLPYYPKINKKSRMVMNLDTLLLAVFKVEVQKHILKNLKKSCLRQTGHTYRASLFTLFSISVIKVCLCPWWCPSGSRHISMRPLYCLYICSLCWLPDEHHQRSRLLKQWTRTDTTTLKFKSRNIYLIQGVPNKIVH